MKRIHIPEPTCWRPEPGVELYFGIYRVPEDISEELAARAVAEGVAHELESKPAPPVAERKVRRASNGQDEIQ